jgi:hypothetical protein
MWWAVRHTAELAPVLPSRNGARDFAAALCELYKSRRQVPLGRMTESGPSLANVLDRDFNVNVQWSETDLIDDRQQRRKEDWYTDRHHGGCWAIYNTPLHMAMLWGPGKRFDAALLLLGRDADIEIRNALGRTVLQEVITRGGWTESVAFLLKHGADPNAATSASSITSFLDRQPFMTRDEPGGVTPLGYAAAEGDEPMVRLLVDAGADANLKLTVPGAWAPLELAMLSRQGPIVDLLIAHAGEMSPFVPNEGAAEPDWKESARQLLSASPKRLLATDCRRLLDRVLSSRGIQSIWAGENAMSQGRGQALVREFFGQLSAIAQAPNPEEPPEPHCSRCSGVQAMRRHGDGSMAWSGAEDMQQSAQSGCPLCSLFLDALKNKDQETDTLEDKCEKIEVRRESGSLKLLHGKKSVVVERSDITGEVDPQTHTGVPPKCSMYVCC